LNRPSATAHRLSIAALLYTLLIPALASAEPLRFALLAKRTDQAFFIQAGLGCAEAAAAEGDSCVLLGAPGPAHFRRQNAALERALADGLDGIALSVTHSRWLAEHALKRRYGPPLITFDSDLLPEYQHLRRAYVGLDNLEYGRQLGRLLQRSRPQGGRLCIISSDPRDTNLAERLSGVRLQLRGSADDGKRLQGENGWYEEERCPLYGGDDQENALLQLGILLATTPLDAVISLGSWPIRNVDAFRQRITPLVARLAAQGRRPTIVIGSGQTNEAQYALLDEGLVQALLTVDSRELGRQTYHVLKRLALGLPVPERVLIGSQVHLPKPAQR